MSYSSNIGHKNFFSYGKTVTTLSTQNAAEILYTNPSNYSHFVPFMFTVRHISGTPASSLAINMGTTASTYNNIGSVVYPTVVGNVIRDIADDFVVNPGTAIYIKNANALSNSTNLVFEIFLFGFHFTAF